MKTNKQLFTLSPLALAVNGALVAMFSMPIAVLAADAAVAELTQPINSVEVGAAFTTQKSAKFGEYTGLNKAEGVVLGGFELNGGDAHDGSNGLTSWQILGRDLGTTSRELKANVSKQGQWDLGVGYDELTHYTTDTYQTPYISTSANSFRLPTGFGTIANANNSLTAAQQAAFHTVDNVGPNRKNTSLSAGYSISPRWGVKFDFNHLDQTGTKVTSIAAAARKFASDTTLPGGEIISYLTTPTNYTTDTMNLAVNWAGDGAYATASYFSSTFKDAYNGYTFQTYNLANNIQTVSTAPSNTFEQINLTGGYKLAEKTKLSGGVSYGVNRQNEAFAVDSFMFVTPSTALGNSKTSMDGLVESTHADVKLSDNSFANWNLAAALKYDDRHNKSASNIYNAVAVDGGNAYNYPNRPLSTEKTQFELTGDYKLSAVQHVLLSYANEDLRRFCSQYAVGGSNYTATTNCVVATRTKEDKLSANYRLKSSEDVALNAGYAYNVRKTDSDVNAITPFIGVRGNDVGTTTGTIKGLNGGDYRGFYPFFNASRTQQAVKGGVNWDANDKLTVGVSGRYTDDKYDSQYGVQDGNSWSASLDVAYNYSETASVTAYVTQQSRFRKMTDLQVSQAQAATTANANRISVAKGSTWTDRLTDEDFTVGIGSKKSGLLGGKFSIEGDLSYSFGTSKYETALNYNTTTSPGSFTCSSSIILSCGSLPTISNEIVSLKLTGTYQKDKQSQIAIGYLFQQQVANDYYFNGLQSGYNPSQVLATNQQAPNYALSVISATYIYTFR